MKEYRNLPYSTLFEDKLSQMLDSVQDCINDNLDKLPEVKSVQVEDPDNGSSLIIKMVLKNGIKIEKSLVRHVDESALELSAILLEAYWGLSSSEAKKYKELLSDPNDLKKLEPTVYKQIRREYILSSMPHNDGGEFLEQDREDLQGLIND